MTQFVHIADERDAASICRNGLSLPKARYREWETKSWKYGVFALPVIDNVLLSHQWVRELARRGHRVSVEVDFRIPDDELVWAGHFN